MPGDTEDFAGERPSTAYWLPEMLQLLSTIQRNQKQNFYLAVTSADPQHSAIEGTLAGLRGYLRCLPGAEEREVIYGTGAWDKGNMLRHPSYERVWQLGKLL